MDRNAIRQAIVAATRGEAIGIHKDLGSPDDFECFGIAQSIPGRHFDHIYLFRPHRHRFHALELENAIEQWGTRRYIGGQLHVI